MAKISLERELFLLRLAEIHAMSCGRPSRAVGAHVIDIGRELFGNTIKYPDPLWKVS